MAESTTSQRVVLSAGGHIFPDPTNPSYIGLAQPLDSFASELFAQCIARIIILQQFDSLLVQQVPTTIAYDNQSANTVSSHPAYKHKQKSLSHFACALDMYLTMIGHTIDSHHIHSHDLHPWNDLADAICTY